ncbi:tetratricopeptide repeat protein [Candidatus Laterigemmans baculatus]|nr:tetratricopeptide repeat protein [Candidatus Laterigemmans baculatus]
MACLGAIGIAAAVGTVGVLYRWLQSGPVDAADRVRLGFAEYVAGHYDVARRLVESLEVSPEEAPEVAQMWRFLVGATGVRLASEAPEPDLVRRETALAVPHLEWNVEHGFPPGRKAEGQRLLGLGLSTLGRFAEAVSPLSEAIAADPTLARELLLPLAEAKLRSPAIDASDALPDIDRLLALPNLEGDPEAQAQLLRARVLTAMGRWKDADATLEALAERIASERALGEGTAEGESQNQGAAGDREFADAVEQAKAERLMAEAASLAGGGISGGGTLGGGISGGGISGGGGPPPAAVELWNRAIAILEEMDRRGDDERGAEARYLAGCALRSAGRAAEALELFNSLRLNRHQTAEAVSSGVEELEMLAEAGRFAEAVEVAENIVREIGDPLTYDTKWLTLPVLKNRITVVVDQMRAAGAYAEAIEIARELPPVFEESESLRIQGDAYREWGEAALARSTARAADDEQERSEGREAREHLRLAGEAYAKAAELHFLDRSYVDLLWEAIESYQAGREFKRSLELLEDYLRYEQRTRKARGLIAQGRALLALDQPQEALRPLEACIGEYPRDPLRYEARLLAAVAQLANGATAAARQSLEQNLFDGQLAPSSPVYRDALFILGESLYRQAHREYLELTTPTLVGSRLRPGDQPNPDTIARFTANQQLLEDAILRLDQAAYRDHSYENLKRSRRATYLAAEARRMAAFWPSIVAGDPETLESARRILNQQRAAHLSEAQQRYRELRQQLSILDQREELEPWERSMLRNCFLAEADMWYELGKFSEAAEAYQNISQQFMNEPVALEALLRQRQCYEELGRGADAARVLQQATRLLQRIPPEEDQQLAETTRYDRDDWQALLQWLQ